MGISWLVAGGNQPGSSQVEDEIEYFREFYKEISPKVFISYEREAFYSTDNTNIRLTLDSNILARDYDLSLRYGVHGDSIIDEDKTILEVKVSDTIPMWLIRFLRDNNIQKTSFSKYGMYYGGKKYA